MQASQRTRQQRFALNADKLVQGVAESAEWNAWRTIAMKGPTLIQQSGLVQTVAFLRSRKEAALRGYADNLATLLDRKDGAALFADARDADLASYLALTRRAIEAATWLRRFAQIAYQQQQLREQENREQRAQKQGDA